MLSKLSEVLLEETFKFLKTARGETYCKIHNLSRLFSELDPVDQDILHEYYRDFRCACEGAKNFPKTKVLDFLNELDAGRKDPIRAHLYGVIP